MSITEQHYTKKGEHPEDRIFKDREYIKRLQRHVYGVFDRLEKDLKLTESGQAHLFDYIFNEESDDISFEEYLDKMGVGYNEISIKGKAKSNYKNVAEAATEFSRQGLGVEETLKRTNDVEGLKVTSSPLTNDWDWDEDVERMDVEIANSFQQSPYSYPVGAPCLHAQLSGTAGAVKQSYYDYEISKECSDPIHAIAPSGSGGGPCERWLPSCSPVIFTGEA